MESRANRLLVIQGRMDQKFIPREQANIKNIVKQTGVELTFVNPLAEKTTITWDKPDVLLHEYGGSLWLGSSDFNLDQPSKLHDRYLNRAMPLAEKILDEGENAMGICMGHQVFAKAAGERVHGIEERKETGTVQLNLIEHGNDDPIFAGLPSSIKMLYGHNRSVEALPDGFTRLGSTERDPNSVLRSNNVITLQGHPELSDANAFRIRLKSNKEYVQTHPVEDPHPAAHTIIVNFMKEVKRSAR